MRGWVSFFVAGEYGLSLQDGSDRTCNDEYAAGKQTEVVVPADIHNEAATNQEEHD